MDEVEAAEEGSVNANMKLLIGLGVALLLSVSILLAQNSPPSTEPKPQDHVTRVGDIDILTDTKGVDFRPYINGVLKSVRGNWYNVIPEVARPPIMKKGNVTIAFRILKDGKLTGMTLVSSSGDISLDRGAWGGILQPIS